MTRIASIDMTIGIAVDYPYHLRDVARGTGDAQLLAIVGCAEAVAGYVEELHAPSEVEEFLADAECARVVAFIDSLGRNRRRKKCRFEARAVSARGQRNPDRGWTVELVREALLVAAQRHDEPGLNENIKECFVILRTFVAYLDRIHGSGGFHEVLTLDERAKVGAFVTQLLRSGQGL